jgi:hypothetical protein
MIHLFEKSHYTWTKFCHEYSEIRAMYKDVNPTLEQSICPPDKATQNQTHQPSMCSIIIHKSSFKQYKAYRAEAWWVDWAIKNYGELWQSSTLHSCLPRGKQNKGPR